jgi:hypothetical protein
MRARSTSSDSFLVKAHRVTLLVAWECNPEIVWHYVVVTVLVQHMPTSSHRKNGYVRVIGVLGFSLCVVQVLPVLPPWSYVEELYGATSGELTISLGVPGLERSVATTLKSFGSTPRSLAAAQHGCRDGRRGCAIITRPVTGSVSGPIGVH